MNPSMLPLGAYAMHPDAHHYANGIASAMSPLQQQQNPSQQQIVQQQQHMHVHHELMMNNNNANSSHVNNAANLNMSGMEAASDSEDDEHGGRSTAMMFDRSLVGDRNNLKTLILRAVYENQIHLQSRKGDAFDSLAKTLSQREEFKPYRLHGRKLQKSFNKIARDIKDCIIQENEPSRWGKEEPEFFQTARKVFEEARRAGIRAFDEKLKSKTITDRLLNDPGMDLDDPAKKKRKREMSMGMSGPGTSYVGVYGLPPNNGNNNNNNGNYHSALQQQMQQQQHHAYSAQQNGQQQGGYLPANSNAQQANVSGLPIGHNANTNNNNNNNNSNNHHNHHNLGDSNNNNNSSNNNNNNSGNNNNNDAVSAVAVSSSVAAAAAAAAVVTGGKYLLLANGDMVPANVSEFMRLNPEFMKLIEDFINARFVELQRGHIRLHSHEIEASLAPALDKFKAHHLHTVQQLLDAAGISDFTKSKIYEITHFQYNDDIKLFLIYYCDIMMRSAQAIYNIQEAFAASPRDATTLYNFIDRIAANNPSSAVSTIATSGVAGNSNSNSNNNVHDPSVNMSDVGMIHSHHHNNNNNNNNSHIHQPPPHHIAMNDNTVVLGGVTDPLSLPPLPTGTMPLTASSSDNNNNNGNTNTGSNNNNGVGVMMDSAGGMLSAAMVSVVEAQLQQQQQQQQQQLQQQQQQQQHEL